MKTGQTAFNHVHRIGVFDYYSQHPEQGRLFDEAMTSFSVPEIAGIVAAYDFSGIGTLVDVADRCEVVPIDFFESVPAAGDAYLMKHIIHDWDDGLSKIILKNCRRAMADNGKLLLAEMVIPPGNDPEFGKWLDIGMLVFTGGRERTAEEYRVLLADSGFGSPESSRRNRR